MKDLPHLCCGQRPRTMALADSDGRIYGYRLICQRCARITQLMNTRQAAVISWNSATQESLWLPG